MMNLKILINYLPSKVSKYSKTLYKQSITDPQRSLRLIKETLLNHAMKKQEGSQEGIQILALLFNKVIIDSWPLENPIEVIGMLKEILMGEKIPNKVKLYLKQSYKLWVEFDDITSPQTFFSQSFMSLEKNHQYFDKSDDHKHIRITVENEQWLLTIITLLLQALPKKNQKMKFASQALDILKILQQNEDDCNAFPHWKLRIQFVAKILEECQNFGLGMQKITFIDKLLYQLSIGHLIQLILSYGNVKHSVGQTICSFCVSEELQSNKNEIIEAKFKVYQVLNILESYYEKNQYRSILSFQGKAQMMESIFSGIRCYISSETFQVEKKLQVKNKQRLISTALKSYFILLKNLKRGMGQQLEFNQPSQFISLLLKELLVFTSYELYLFENDPEEFYDRLTGICFDPQYETVKAAVSNIICSMYQKNEELKNNFLTISKSSLINAFNTIQNVGVNKETIFLQTENSLLLLCMLNEEIEGNQWPFQKKLVSLKSLEKMNNLVIVLILFYLTNLNQYSFIGNTADFKIISFGLIHKSQIVKLATFRLLQKLSKKIYSDSYFSIILKQMQSLGLKKDLNYLSRWTILRNVIIYHYSSLKIQTKAGIISNIRNKLALEISSSFQSKRPYNNDIYHKCIDVTLRFLQNLALDKIHLYLKRCLIDICSFFQYLPSLTIKQHMVQVIHEVLLLNCNKNQKISIKLRQLVPHLLSYFKESQNLNVLKTFKLYMDEVHIKNKCYLTNRIFSIFQWFYEKISYQSKREKIDETILYYSLIFVNYYLLYFGNVIDKKQIKRLQSECRYFLTKKMPQILKMRLLNTLFSCCLYEEQGLMISEILKMKQSVRQFYHPYELQILVSTCQTYFLAYSLGGLQKYKYLEQLLYQISCFIKSNIKKNIVHEKIQSVIDIMTEGKLKDNVFFEEQCIKIMRKFKENKNEAYNMVHSWCSPLVKKCFYFSEEKQPEIEKPFDPTFDRKQLWKQNKQFKLRQVYYRYIYLVNPHNL